MSQFYGYKQDVLPQVQAIFNALKEDSRRIRSMFTLCHF